MNAEDNGSPAVAENLPGPASPWLTFAIVAMSTVAGITGVLLCPFMGGQVTVAEHTYANLHATLPPLTLIVLQVVHVGGALVTVVLPVAAVIVMMLAQSIERRPVHRMAAAAICAAFTLGLVALIAIALYLPFVQVSGPLS